MKRFALRFVSLFGAFVLLLVLFVQPALAAGQVHVVQRGESLWSIASRYGTTAYAVAQANGISNWNLIYAGQRLTIPSGGSSGAASGSTYIVQRGDTLSGIAARYGTTVAALMQRNGLSSANYIYVGQRLAISGAGSSGGSSGGSAGGTYVVRRGDTLAAIAARYGTTVAAIVRANGIANPSLIVAGQRLTIPGSSGGGGVAPGAGGSGQRIVVDLSDQRMYVYYNGQLVWNWVVSTGRPGQSTAVGHWKVLNKIPSAWASTWSLKMPYWLGIYWAGSLQNGIHALPILPNGQTLWAGYLGTPVSYGCIILSTQNAQTLYNWVGIGTPVDVVW
ncbi:MAG TPA: LysM peptidoglycan-binding domain-containing protein [Anaerolineae bacterium]|nr:LysM peptidoglycan-binding domain-containing protein [Anaerolineae bacterium]